MSKVNFSDEFKRDAVFQIIERGYPVTEVSQRLGVSQHSLYAWKKKFSRPSGGGDGLAPIKWRDSVSVGGPFFELDRAEVIQR
jgi:transposase